MKTKYIFVTGGVVSSLGKGITASAIGQLLKNRGLKVFMQKFDPYLNVDPGQLNPLQHGEVFVTSDGAETDLDLGHYERFIDEELSQYSSVSSGMIFQNVFRREKKGKYKGSTVQVIPHVTNEIKHQLRNAAKYSNADIIITEIGGTIGDIESLPFLEAIRQFRHDVGYSNCMYIHTTLVPYIETAKEYKTKPTQHSVKELRSIGIQPDIICLRCDKNLSRSIKSKISMFCNVDVSNVLDCSDVKIIYEMIIKLHKQKIDKTIINHFKINKQLKEPNLTKWEELISNIKIINNSVKIALVGKYTQLEDAYISTVEALKHAGYKHMVNIDIKWINSLDLNNQNAHDYLKDVDGIIIPGGFGKVATNGLIQALRYGRENKIPTFGICYGMQFMAIEFARHVLNLKGAQTEEINPRCENKIFIKNDRVNKRIHKARLRVGSFPVMIVKNTKLHNIYNKDEVMERHRHAYKFNKEYLNLLEDNGLIISSYSGDNDEYVESFELKDHPFYLSSQFHPEYISRPLRAHPLFLSFIKASIDFKNNK